MKKRICSIIGVVILSSFVLQSVVMAGGPIAQGITVRVAPVYVSDAQGWHQIGTVPPGTKVGIYWFDSNWVKNDPNQWMRRQDIRIYGVDPDPVTQVVSPLLSQVGSPIQVGEVVQTKPNCATFYGPGLNPYGTVPINASVKVVNKDRGWLFVHINSDSSRPAWVKENDVYRVATVVASPPSVQIDLTGVKILVISAITNHISGTAINVTLGEAKEAITLALRGLAGTVYTRSDGRIMIDITRGPYRYVAFLNSGDGSLGSYFPPDARGQLAGGAKGAAKYISNVIYKGGYWPIDFRQVPEPIKAAWGVSSSLIAAVGVILRTTETMLVAVIIPEGYFRTTLSGSVQN